jgi:hypothetical protein
MRGFAWDPVSKRVQRGTSAELGYQIESGTSRFGFWKSITGRLNWPDIEPKSALGFGRREGPRDMEIGLRKHRIRP